ncbi:MAG: DNA replication/repair protein RecF [Coxiellaceae bacterium]|nr:DNA replication/repair protein RecF [Coxiellaceae bacterium]
MQLNKLVLQQFRNISHAELCLSPHINLFIGENGAGKSSLLEAVYLLSYGRSFRSSQQERLIQHNTEAFTLFTELSHGSKDFALGYERNVLGKSQIKINGANKTSLSALSAHLPSQLLTTTSYRYFTDGPKLRRSHLNWGVFYQDTQFGPLWSRLQKSLKQRNAALKERVSREQVSAWDPELILHSESIHKLRASYVAALQPVLQQLLAVLLDGYQLQLCYEPGWNTDLSFSEALDAGYFRDTQVGYTTQGPHRADMQMYLDDLPAHLVLSQGQQKLAVYALCFAQGLLLSQHSHTTPVYLIDDLVSELDSQKIECLAQVLQQISAQTLITGIHQHLFQPIIDALPTETHLVSNGCLSINQPAPLT